MNSDEYYVARCIEIARQAEGRTSPNPLVGAVVVDDDGTIIAEGIHAKYGGPHAEVEALDTAGERARGKTLFVSLEPCCHFGKTPPCSDRVIAAGLKRVVFGMLDPNPKVAGGGNAALTAAGIATSFGILEKECRYLNRGFLKWFSKQLPWVTLKIAATIDGRIADRHRQSRWISGEAARQYVQQLRNRYDCVLLGGASAVQDDSELTVRDLSNGRNPIRAVIDRQLNVNAQSRLAMNDDGKTWLFASDAAIKSTAKQYSQHVRLIPIKETGDHLDLRSILEYLGEQKVRTVLCEGGGRLAGALLQHGLVDEIAWIIAPKLLTDTKSVPAVDGIDERSLGQAIELISRTYKELGADFLIQGLINEP